MDFIEILRRFCVFFSAFVYIFTNGVRGSERNRGDGDKYQIKPTWKLGEPFDIWIYAMEESIQVNFNENDLILFQSSSSLKETVEKRLEVSLKKSIFSKSKPSDLYAHIYITKTGTHPDPLKSGGIFDPRASAYRRLPLTLRKNDDILWYPEIKIAIIEADKFFGEGGLAINPSIIRHMSVVPDKPVILPSKVVGREYLPFIMASEFWRLREKFITATRKNKNPLSISIKRMSLLRFRILCEIEETMRLGEELLLKHFKNQEINNFFLNEWDKIKEIFFDCNPLLLGTTVLVSILHFIFSFLSFKTDFSFWRTKSNKKTNISKRSLGIGCVMHLIILLYLFDQDKRSFMVIVPSVISFLLECWKLSLLFCSNSSSGPNDVVNKYDSDGMKFLFLTIIPILIGRVSYSLLKGSSGSGSNSISSVYSEVLRILTGATYSFGFISMFPQLYLNYKTKSVAPLPWKVFIYRALNTFIDDLFSFVVKMPTMHRIACLRDDVAFIIYLYQCWIYPSKSVSGNGDGVNDLSLENSKQCNNIIQDNVIKKQERKERKPKISKVENEKKANTRRKSTRIQRKPISMNS